MARDVVRRLRPARGGSGFRYRKGVGELVAGHANFVGGKAVEHEGIIGVRTVGDGDFGSPGSKLRIRVCWCSRSRVLSMGETAVEVNAGMVIGCAYELLRRTRRKPVARAAAATTFSASPGKKGSTARVKAALAEPWVNAESHRNPQNRITRLPIAALRRCAESAGAASPEVRDQRGRSRIRQQISAGRTQQMRNASPKAEAGCENGQSQCTFNQVSAQCGGGEARSEQQAKEQDREGLHGQRNRGKPERKGHVRRCRDEHASQDNDCGVAQPGGRRRVEASGDEIPFP